MKATTDTRIPRGKASLLHRSIMMNLPKSKKDSIRPMLDEMIQIVNELCEEIDKQTTTDDGERSENTKRLLHYARCNASLLHRSIMMNLPKSKKDSIRPMLDEMIQIVNELCEEIDKQTTTDDGERSKNT